MLGPGKTYGDQAKAVVGVSIQETTEAELGERVLLLAVHVVLVFRGGLGVWLGLTRLRSILTLGQAGGQVGQQVTAKLEACQ